MISMNDVAICCMSGGYKSVFTHGVLKAFEDAEIRAKAYAACSSSVLIAAFAAFNKISRLDLTLWSDGYEISQRNGNQSEAMLESIDKLSQDIVNCLWDADAARLLVATSYVKTEEAALITQSTGAKRLGQMLLINSLKHKSDWKDQNLESEVFDTHSDDKNKLLTKQNFKEVAYATTRMLHAWNIPAYINNKAYVDGSYTFLCPVQPLSELGYKKIVCISTEKGKVAFDLFSEEAIPNKIGDSTIDFIKPDCELKEMGVDFYAISDYGLEKVYKHGYAKGLDYIRNCAG